ncbi:MAG: adenylate/guanylate cyclase domain-containing protein [Verrucomicrobia bacterium]|nr:MAG: adenylate/guanylate cyclase domain-containing protein [Verrucomicrobiota bacterium]
MAERDAKKPARGSSGGKGQNSRRLQAVVFGALLASAVGFLLYEFNLGRRVKSASYDLLHIFRGDIPTGEAVIVYMDDASHGKLKQPFNAPWDRRLHAQLIDRLRECGARAVVFDVVFSDPDARDPEADQRLAEAMKRHGRVVLAADNVPAGEGVMKVVPPCETLLNSAAGVGSAERLPDADLVVRRHTLRGESPISTLAWTTAELLEAGVTKQPGAEEIPRWMHYYGHPGIIPSISYYQALDPAAVASRTFSNKVVFVGARLLTKFAGDRKDEFPNPYSSFSPSPRFMAGVEIQATEFINLTRADWLHRPSKNTERTLLILCGIILGVGMIFLRPIPAAIIAVLLILIAGSVAQMYFERSLTIFPWLIVAIQVVVALAWSVLFNSVQLYVQKRLFEYTIGLYLSPKLVAKFASSPAMLKPGAEKQTLTFLFSDIADFTSISEGMDGQELAGMMNDYFQPAVANCIHATEGTVVKYIGDAIFALWNAPESQSDHAARACKAALLFRDQSKLPVRGRTLRTRIGLHTGPAYVGNFGSEDRVDYTAIGENVNLASRLEGLNKHLGTDCLISGATQAEIGGKFVTRKLGQFQLKGFVGLVEVHELVAFPEQAEATRTWRESFAEALNNFEQRNLVFAEIGFRRVLEMKPEDGPAKFYLARIQELSEQQLPEAWATHTIVKEK